MLQSLNKFPRLFRMIGETVAIVLSILLAFAIDAWWQDRAEYREETSALRALRDEFEANREVLERFIAFHSDLQSSARAVLQLAADPTAETAAEEVDRLIVDITWWGSPVSFESAALDAVILGAKLDLLDNEALRRMLADWRSQLVSTSGQNAQEFEHFYGALLPVLRSRANLAQISNASLRVPGEFFDDPGARLPVPQAAWTTGPSSTTGNSRTRWWRSIGSKKTCCVNTVYSNQGSRSCWRRLNSEISGRDE